MIIYEGPSAIDGAPIVAIATGLENPSDNAKTGAMVQVFIIRADIAPIRAYKIGADFSICGNCPHRWHTGGFCYVNIGQAPGAVFRAYQAGQYPDLDATEFYGRAVRFGAYGDPAAVPFSAWAPILDACDIDNSTGYTHQAFKPWFDSRIAMFCQVSTDTEKQTEKAWRLGYKTFRVRTKDSVLPGEIECLSDARGIACIDCKLCDGQTANVFINAHGSRAPKTIEVINL